MNRPDASNDEGTADTPGSRDQRDTAAVRDHFDEVDRTVERTRGEFPDFLSLPQ